MSDDRGRGFAMFGALRSALGGGESRVNTSEQVNQETRVVIPIKHAVTLCGCIAVGLGAAYVFVVTPSVPVAIGCVAVVTSCVALGLNQYRYLDMPHWSTSTPDDIAKRRILYPAMEKYMAGGGDLDLEEYEESPTIPVQSGNRRTSTAPAPNGRIQAPARIDLNYLEFLRGALDIGLARDGVWYKKPRRRFVMTGDIVVKSVYDEMIQKCIDRGLVQPGGKGAAHEWVDGVESELEDVYASEVHVLCELFPDWVRLNPKFDVVHYST